MNSTSLSIHFKRKLLRNYQLTQQLKALEALTKDLCSISNIHVAVCNNTKLYFKGIQCPPLAFIDIRHAQGAQTCMYHNQHITWENKSLNIFKRGILLKFQTWVWIPNSNYTQIFNDSKKEKKKLFKWKKSYFFAQ